MESLYYFPNIFGVMINFTLSIVDLASIGPFGEEMVPQERRGSEQLSSTFLPLSHR